MEKEDWELTASEALELSKAGLIKRAEREEKDLEKRLKAVLSRVRMMANAGYTDVCISSLAVNKEQLCSKLREMGYSIDDHASLPLISWDNPVNNNNNG